MEKHVTLPLLEAAITRVNKVVVSLIAKATESFNKAISSKVDDAPKDGKSYVRKDAEWVESASTTIEFATEEEVNEMLDNIFGKEESNEG